jgi:FecR-like protein
MSNFRLIALSSVVGLAALTAHGAPFTEARVTKIFNKVEVTDPAKGTHPASLHETIKDDIELKTGVKSRSELLFQDETLARVGPETSFSFKSGTRDISLGKGAMLLQVPKGLGGAKIRTAAVTAAITGTTIMIEHTPGKHLKVLVLEGSLRLSVNGPFGDSVVLHPGRMVLMRPDAKKIPPPVSVDLKRIMRSSSLVNMSKKGGPSLPSLALIEKEIAQQAHDKLTADLVDTGLAIHGSGTTALNSTGRVIDVLARNEQGRPLTVSSDPTPSNPTTSTTNPSPTPSANSPGPSPGPASTPGAGPSPGPVSTPAPTPTTSGNGDDNEKGDHNNDGHPDNGKGKDKTHGGRKLTLPAPAVDRARPSLPEKFSQSVHSSRNDR